MCRSLKPLAVALFIFVLISGLSKARADGNDHAEAPDAFTLARQLTEEFKKRGAPGSFLVVNDGSSETNNLQGLRRIQQALTKLKHPADFSRFSRLFVSSKTHLESFDYGGDNFYIPYGFPTEAYFEILSAQPDLEEGYTEFKNKMIYEKAERKQTVLGKWTEDYEQTIVTFCQDREKAPIQSQKSLFPENQNLRSIQWSAKFRNDQFQSAQILFFLKPLNSASNSGQMATVSHPLLKVNLDKNCEMESLEMTTFDLMAYVPVKRSTYSEAWELLAEKLMNPKILSLEEIYSEDVAQDTFQLSRAEVLERARSPKKVIVGVIDSGVDYNHPLLANKIPRVEGKIKGYDYGDKDDRPYDYTEETPSFFKEVSFFFGEKMLNHGTHVAGIVVEDTEDIEVLPIRFSLRDLFPMTFGIESAAKAGAKVINMSFTMASQSGVADIRRSIEAHSEILFVVAAGNENANLDKLERFPARWGLKNVLVVASVDHQGKRAGSSSYSEKWVDVAARGVDVYSSVAGGQMEFRSGTSMATPKVSNLAARIWLERPELTVEQVKEIILSTVDPREGLEVKTAGEINVEKALKAAREYNND